MNSNKVVVILEHALHLVERGWCQHYSAKFSLGRFSMWLDDVSIWANKFCALGALSRASAKYDENYWKRDSDEYRTALRYLAAEVRIEGAVMEDGAMVITWNDDDRREHQEIVAAFHRALTKARADDASKKMQVAQE